MKCANNCGREVSRRKAGAEGWEGVVGKICPDCQFDLYSKTTKGTGLKPPSRASFERKTERTNQ